MLLLTIFCVLMLLFVRTAIVFRADLQQIDLAYRMALEDIKTGAYDHNADWDRYPDSSSKAHALRVLDLTKWRREHFYPAGYIRRTRTTV